jgi:hypothetical protein
LRIPQKVRVGSCDYTVELTEETLVNPDRRICYGVMDADDHKLRIDRKLGDTQLHELVFLHELLHAMVHERNINLENEELVVEELSRSLHQIIRDNPEMFKA